MNNVSTVFLLLSFGREWLESIEINNFLACLVCRTPARCPFEPEFKLFNQTLFSIPSLCRFNQFYKQLLNIGYRSLTYLGDEWREDQTLYC